MVVTGGPLHRVIAAIEAGAGSRAAVAQQAGLDADVVDACVDHLVRIGRVTAEQLGGGCPESGCGSCGSGRPDGTSGCGASGPATARGPVLLTLRTRAGG